MWIGSSDMGKPKNRSGNQDHDDRAVLNIVACLERVIPMIEDL